MSTSTFLYHRSSMCLEDGWVGKLNSIRNLQEAGLDALLVLDTATFQREA
jgi:hypothetical protein